MTLPLVLSNSTRQCVLSSAGETHAAALAACSCCWKSSALTPLQRHDDHEVHLHQRHWAWPALRAQLDASVVVTPACFLILAMYIRRVLQPGLDQHGHGLLPAWRRQSLRLSTAHRLHHLQRAGMGAGITAKQLCWSSYTSVSNHLVIHCCLAVEQNWQPEFVLVSWMHPIDCKTCFHYRKPHALPSA
jgi:hypothetical protein